MLLHIYSDWVGVNVNGSDDL